MMETFKQLILAWCIKQVIHNLRSVQPKKLRELKARLNDFNASKMVWDAPNKTKVIK